MSRSAKQSSTHGVTSGIGPSSKVRYTVLPHPLTLNSPFGQSARHHRGGRSIIRINAGRLTAYRDDWP